MFYAPSTKGFYSLEIHGDRMPSDAVEISDALYEACKGQQIATDEAGLPCLYTPPPPSQAELIDKAKDETRIQRQPIISMLDGLQASALVKSDVNKALMIETAKQALRDITSTDLSGCQTHEEMRLAIKARYVQIVSAAPSLKAAFSEALK